MHPFHLVAQHNGIFLIGLGNKVLQLSAMLHLLYGIDPIAFGVEALHGFGGRLEVSPAHAVLCAKGGLVDFGGWRRSTYAAKINGRYAESVRRTEHTPHIVHRAHIVEHHHEGQLVGLAELIDGEPLHLYRA